ncbi:hypothetical protein I2I11_16325 [Pontibacter sp. 172403-2]|uniref:hypothetical protein n=1 Tax=Pontibacter rufus TaxID=2791028 RepID=UPI0018AFD45F|nr:hypothetical protein [Pontibacter sp. 172403-2]MBF9254870.1 hypothetical protein [Pontibacter sp. 172403-2]
MKYLLTYSLALLSPVLLFSSCRKEPNYPDTPQIEFRRVEQTTDQENGILHDDLTLVIGYKDGDGNLGLSKTDTASGDFNPPFDLKSPYFNNFFADLQVKRGNTYVPYFENTALNFNGRFPRLSGDGREEALEGEIKYTISSFYSDVFDASDTIRFEIYIYDRALNKSNVVYTDDIVLFTGQPKL